jgi:hypothetical protein
MFHILANLDQEEHWLGTRLSRKVQERISAMSVLLDVLGPADDDTTIWTLAPVAPHELRPPRSDRPPVMATGSPPHVDLVWCSPDARRFNDRRFALALARRLGCALPRATELASLAELDAHLAAGPDAAWVVKAPWSSAGRHRVFGANRTLTGEARVAAERLIALVGAVTFEPWLDRICDVAVCGVIGDDVRVDPPHAIHTDPRGGFRGIGLERPPLDAAEHDQLIVTAERVAHALQEAGYRGPFGVDAFVYRDGGERRMQPLCEINARFTFGHVARALDTRFGVTRLGFDKWGRPELTGRA